MSMEIKLTDIRGEPPLQVGEFILDKDNNVLYVGSGNFGLTRNGGAEIGVIARFIPIPPNKAFVNIQDRSNVGINIIGRVIPIPIYKATINVQDNSNVSVSVGCKFSELRKVNANIDIQDNSNINLRGSGKIVT